MADSRFDGKILVIKDCIHYFVISDANTGRTPKGRPVAVDNFSMTDVTS